MAGCQWSAAMKNGLEIDGYKAIVSFDPETNLFRGESL